MANLFDAIASAAANIVTQIRDYIDTVALVEKDPTVPAWAKKDVKPSYTADEISGISKAGKTGSYLDLLDKPDLSRLNPPYEAVEFDTGRKWVDGKTIYCMAVKSYFSVGTGVNYDTADFGFAEESEWAKVDKIIDIRGTLVSAVGNVYSLLDSKLYLLAAAAPSYDFYNQYAGNSSYSYPVIRLRSYHTGWGTAEIYYTRTDR